MRPAMSIKVDEMSEIEEWLRSMRTADDVARESYTSLRNSWPGQKPKWLRQPWEQLPQPFRGLLVDIAERAVLTSDKSST